MDYRDGVNGTQSNTGNRIFVGDWLPARLLLLAFAVTGDWVGCREQLANDMQDLDASSADVLSNGAHAALGLKTTVFREGGDTEAFEQVANWELSQLSQLLTRSAIAWVVAVAGLVLLA